MSTELFNNLSRAIVSGKNRIEHREALRLLSRAMGLDRLVTRAAAGETISRDELVEIRNRVYLTMGTPGDWGYGSPLGEALRKLYDAEFQDVSPPVGAE